MFFRGPRDISSHVCCDQNKRKHPNPTFILSIVLLFSILSAYLVNKTSVFCALLQGEVYFLQVQISESGRDDCEDVATERREGKMRREAQGDFPPTYS